MLTRIFSLPFFLLFFLAVIFLMPLSAAAADARVVQVIKIDGVISPVIAEYLEKGLKRAADRNAEAVVIQLDTPGGLDTAMRQIVKNIIASPVPVITFVSPSGARAASAGAFITIASPIAAMAPGTNIGAAHPVNMGGQGMDKVMAEKVENDSAAYIVSLASKYKRNTQWAEQAVRKSVSISESEALRNNVIDLVADNLEDLLNKVDGRKVVTALGEKRLNTKNAVVDKMEMSARIKFLMVISDPNIAYILMMIGIIGIFFELSNPGLIFPGVVGGISLILAFYSFQTLPVNYAGLLLILLAIVFFIAEVKITSYGLLSVAGVVSLLLGSIMLIDSQAPYMKISLKVILPAVITLATFFIILLRVAIRARRSRVTGGAEGLVGEEGEARTDIGTQGDVFIQGAHWGAYSDLPVRKGDKVVVLKVEGLKLKVTKKP
jgi:membrane-bound serine protease (ClpP class)